MHKLLLLMLALSMPAVAHSSQEEVAPPSPPPDAPAVEARSESATTFELRDGRRVTGWVTSRQANLLSVEGEDGHRVVLRAEDIRGSTVGDLPAPVLVEERPVGRAPSARDFAGRMVLVSLGAVFGEGAGAVAGLLIGAQIFRDLSATLLGGIIGGAAGTVLGGALFGSGAPGGLTGPAVAGIVLGGVGGTLLALGLAGIIGPVALLLPALCAVLGAGVGFSVGDAAPGSRSASAGVRVLPSVAVSSRGTVQSVLVGSF